MKILILTPYLPAPPNTGGRRRVHAVVTRLSRTHDVTVASFIAPDGERDAVAATRAIASRLVTVRNGRSNARGLRKRLLQLRSLFSRESFARLVFTTAPMQAAIDRLAREQRFDVVIVEFAQMAGYRLPDSALVVLDEHNVEYDVLARSWRSERGLFRRAFNFIESRKLRAEERRAWAAAEGCMFTSDRDRDLAIANGCDGPTAVVPNGVDVETFASDRWRAGQDILFFGADFAPNADALRFYADEVLPRVRSQRISTRLIVVGGCAVALTDREREGVDLVGPVNDVRRYIASAAVVIAPLRIGGGTRLKILEAMAMARPVVATRIGAEGIDATHGRELLIADDADGLARETLRALRDAELAETIGAAARELVTRRYDWDQSVARLERFVRRLALAPRRAYWHLAARERAS